MLIDNPQDLQRVDAIHQLLRGQKIKLAVGLRKDIDMYLAAGRRRAASKDNIGNILSDLGDEATARDRKTSAAATSTRTTARSSGWPTRSSSTRYKARASDIHVEPYGAQKDTMIRLRIDGQCREYQRIPGAYRRALAARLKIMAQLDIAERRKPQDGKIKFRLPDGRDIELRVATLPTQGGNEDVVMRAARRQRADPRRQARA